MSIKTLEQLYAQKLGTVITADEIECDVPVRTVGKPTSRWDIETSNHQFKIGDVYIIPASKHELASFRMYLSKTFRLGCSKKEQDGKFFCLVRELQKTPAGLIGRGRPKVPATPTYTPSPPSAEALAAAKGE